MADYIQTTLGLLGEPFMLRALYGGLVIGVLTAIVGVFVTLKKESFIVDAVSHGSLAGVAVGLVFSSYPLAGAVAAAVLMSLAITYLKRKSKISVDAIIGIVFAFLFSLGVILLWLNASYRPELETYLFGNLLTLAWADVLVALLVLFVVTGLVWANYRELLYSTFDEEGARVNGVAVNKLDYLYGLFTAVSVVVAVKLAGIILVTALFVIPATSAKLLARNFKQMIPFAIFHNLLAVLMGVFFSTFLPPGPVIVLTSTLLVAFVFAFKQMRS